MASDTIERVMGASSVTGSAIHSSPGPVVTSSAGTIRVGTASWTEKTLLESGAFYPPTARTPEQRLRYYAARFGVVEVDATYYALPSARNAAAWAERTPDDFRFGVKAFAAMTGHPIEPRRLDRDLAAALPNALRTARSVDRTDLPAAVVDEIWRRFRANLEPLVVAGKLAYVLLQMPPWFAPGDDEFAELEAAATRLRPLPCAIEFRQADWLAPARAEQTLAWLRDRGLVYVCVDEPQGTRASVPPVAEATSDALAVVRFHGRRLETWTRSGVPTTERFRYHYSRDELREWVPRLRALAARGRSVLALMNNCYRDAAVRNAQDLTALLSEA
jgi:uncharacterized protein YecE (DUF72 family)